MVRIGDLPLLGFLVSIAGFAFREGRKKSPSQLCIQTNQPRLTEPNLRSEPWCCSSVRWKFHTISITLSQRELRNSFFLLPPLRRTLTLWSSTLFQDQFSSSTQSSQCHCEFTYSISISKNPSILSLQTNLLPFIVFHIGHDFENSFCCFVFVSR